MDLTAAIYTCVFFFSHSRADRVRPFTRFSCSYPSGQTFFSSSSSAGEIFQKNTSVSKSGLIGELLASTWYDTTTRCIYVGWYPPNLASHQDIAVFGDDRAREITANKIGDLSVGLCEMTLTRVHIVHTFVTCC